MSRWSWLLTRSLTSRRRFAPGPRPRRPAARCRPQVEALEDRAVPAVLTVNTLADENDADDGRLSLREAIAAANAQDGDDTIAFSVTGTINLGSALPELSSNLALTGPGADRLTVRRDSGGDYRIFTVTGSATAALSGLTVSNGRAASGGGIRNDGTLTLTDCTVSGNAATDGGGLFNSVSGFLTLTGCTISGNSADRGGGLFNDLILTLTGCTVSDNSATQSGGGIFNRNGLGLIGCTVSDNSAGHLGGGIYNEKFAPLFLTGCTVGDNSADLDGGGIYNHSGELTLTRCTVIGNSAVLDGGGIFNTNLGTLPLTDCTVSSNSADRGGGIYNEGKRANGTLMKLTGCTVSGNFARSDGGGILNAGTLTLTSCTVTRNLANFDVGGSGIGGGLFSTGTLTMVNTIVADNSTIVVDFMLGVTVPEDDIQGGVDTANSFHNLVGTGGAGGLTNGQNGNLVGVADPGLGALAFNGGTTQTHALLPQSPALDAGTAGGAPSTDQRGAGRVGPVDIGAFERQHPLFAVGDGRRPLVRVYDAATGTQVHSFSAFDDGYRGGVRVALGDVNHDGVSDILAGTARGPARVQVFSGLDPSTVLYDFNAFGGRAGGVSVAAGDLDGDGFADIIVGRAAGPAVVKVFSGHDGTLLSSFRAYGGGYTGGVNVAAADLDRDGALDLITAGNGGGRVPVQVFSGADPGQRLQRFFAYGAGFKGPVFVAAGDTNNDGQVDLVTGAGPGSAPQVRVFDGGDPRRVLHSFMAYAPASRHGVTVAAADRDGDGVVDLLVGQASGAPQVKTFDGLSAAEVDDFFAFEPGYAGGVFVGG